MGKTCASLNEFDFPSGNRLATYICSVASIIPSESIGLAYENREGRFDVGKTCLSNRLPVDEEEKQRA